MGNMYLEYFSCYPNLLTKYSYIFWRKKKKKKILQPPSPDYRAVWGAACGLRPRLRNGVTFQHIFNFVAEIVSNKLSFSYQNMWKVFRVNEKFPKTKQKTLNLILRQKYQTYFLKSKTRPERCSYWLTFFFNVGIWAWELIFLSFLIFLLWHVILEIHVITSIKSGNNIIPLQLSQKYVISQIYFRDNKSRRKKQDNIPNWSTKPLLWTLNWFWMFFKLFLVSVRVV